MSETDVPVIYAFQSQEARDFADLLGIKKDLLRVRAFLQYMASMPEPDPEAHPEATALEDALYTASLIIYRRCFKHGARARIDRQEIADIHPDALAFHDHHMHLADKLAAHSVNAFEQVKIGIQIYQDEIQGTAYMYMRLQTNRNNIPGWTTLVDTLLQRSVLPKLRNADKATLEAAQQRPVHDIKRAEPMRVTTPNPQDAGIRR